MESREFSFLVEQLHGHIQVAIHEFFQTLGVSFDGIEYARNGSCDHEQLARELMMFGGNLWVKTDEEVSA